MAKRISQSGFTLVEAVVVIALAGIVAGMVAVFIRSPLEGYFDASRRAEMTDVADTALRRISRDLHRALPNSVRVSGGTALEFLHTRGGGRYRADVASDGSGDILDFTQNDPTGAFDVLGPVDATVGDSVVVYNLGPDVSGANAYAGDNLRTITSFSGSAIGFSPTTRFPFDSPNHRFYVVDSPVSYICSGGALRRYSGYAVAAAQPNPPAGGTSALLAQNATCTFAYNPGVDARGGLVTITLSITEGGETVNLYQEVHVDNAP